MNGIAGSQTLFNLQVSVISHQTHMDSALVNVSLPRSWHSLQTPSHAALPDCGARPYWRAA